MLISKAFAQDVTTTAAGEPSMLITMAPLVIIFVLFYLLIIRPQSKRIKEQSALLQAVKPGDKVITGGGLHATVIKVTDTDMTLEIASGVHVKAQKHTVNVVVPETIKPVADIAKKNGK